MSNPSCRGGNISEILNDCSEVTWANMAEPGVHPAHLRLLFVMNWINCLHGISIWQSIPTMQNQWTIIFLVHVGLLAFWQAFRKHLKNSFKNITFEQYLNSTDGSLMQNDGVGCPVLGRAVSVYFKEPNVPSYIWGQQQSPTSPEWPGKGMGF